jgi:hypothetical protein
MRIDIITLFPDFLRVQNTASWGVPLKMARLSYTQSDRPKTIGMDDTIRSGDIA